MAGMTENLGQIWKILMKDVDHHSWITYIWDVLKENVQSAMTLWQKYRDMFEARISAGTTAKLPAEASGET